MSLGPRVPVFGHTSLFRFNDCLEYCDFAFSKFRYDNFRLTKALIRLDGWTGRSFLIFVNPKDRSYRVEVSFCVHQVVCCFVGQQATYMSLMNSSSIILNSKKNINEALRIQFALTCFIFAMPMLWRDCMFS